LVVSYYFAMGKVAFRQAVDRVTSEYGARRSQIMAKRKRERTAVGAALSKEGGRSLPECRASSEDPGLGAEVIRMLRRMQRQMYCQWSVPSWISESRVELEGPSGG